MFLGILIDHETPNPEEASGEFDKQYDDIMCDTAALLHKWANPNTALLELYPVPTVDIDGKR